MPTTRPSWLAHPADVTDLLAVSQAEAMATLMSTLGATIRPPTMSGVGRRAARRAVVAHAVVAVVGFVLVVALYTLTLQRLVGLAP